MKTNNPILNKQEDIKLEGVITSIERGGLFRVENLVMDGGLPLDVAFLLCRPCSKIRQKNIKLVPGDKVVVEVSIFENLKDKNPKGKITWRK